MGPSARQRRVVSGPYQPDKGDFVWLDFTPNAGTEQGGRRPALVLSPKRFNIATGLMLACPVTSTVKNSPWEVPVPRGAGLKGVVLSSHVRSLDWIARNVEFHSRADGDAVADVLARIEAILGADS